MDEHLSRRELIEAAQGGESAFAEHLQQCAECRSAISLLRRFPVWGQVPLPDAPPGWIARATALAEGAGVIKKSKDALARLVFDSWAAPQPIGVRGEGTDVHRRIRFQAEPVLLDLRAEQQGSGWAFVAQLSGDKAFVADAVIEVGRRKMHADAAGFFQWSSRRPPALIIIRSGDTRIETPEVSWRPPRPM